MKMLELALLAGVALVFLSRKAEAGAAPAASAKATSEPITLPYVPFEGGSIGSATGTIDLALAAQQDWNATHDPRATTSDTLAAFLRALPRPQWESQLTVWYRTLPDKEMIHLAQAKALGAI